MFSWFDAQEEVAFGLALAKFFMERVSRDEREAKGKTLQKRQEVLGKMMDQIDGYRRSHKLNVYKKAKFGNTFSWALKDERYDSGFVDGLTKELLLRM